MFQRPDYRVVGACLLIFQSSVVSSQRANRAFLAWLATDHRQLSTDHGQVTIPPIGEGIMYCLNVWLTVKDAANVEMVRKLLTEQVRLSRAEPGCLRFEAYHSEADPRRFLLV